MTSRERVLCTLSHRQPDRVPMDLGASNVSGVSASTLYKLRAALGLPEKPVEIVNVPQLLGAVDDDVRQKLGVDVVGLFNPANLAAGTHSVTQPFTMSDGTPILLPDELALETKPNGSVVMYPAGDRTAEPSMMIPAGGSFFEPLDRSPPFDEDNLTPAEDFEGSFLQLNEADAAYYAQKVTELYNTTDCAVLGVLTGGGLGDHAQLTGPQLKNPRGIRRLDDWLMAHLLYPDYIKTIFRMQTDAMLRNFEIYRQAVGSHIQIICFSGTDFGTQNGPFIAPKCFQALYKPFYTEMNAWIHTHTNWKTFYHSCGSMVEFLDDFVEMGVDILNPVQLSAKGMDAQTLKSKYGGKLVFWGGGVDTQKTLPFGTPAEVKAEVKQRLGILAQNGGYVFNAIHNLVAKLPTENVLAMYEALAEYNAGNR